MWAGTSQLCHLSLCLSCQSRGKAPFISSVSFSARLGGLERDQGPNHCVNQSSTSDKQILCLLFLFCLPGRIFKTTKAKTQVTFCFQAHPVPSQGKKKPTEQHLLIKSLFSSPCLFLTQGSANWFPHSADQRGKWSLQQRTVKRSALPECREKPHYFWMSGREHSGDSLPYFPLWIGDCPPQGWPAHLPIPAWDTLPRKGLPRGEMGHLPSRHLNGLFLGGFHGTAIPTLEGDK